MVEDVFFPASTTSKSDADKPIFQERLATANGSREITSTYLYTVGYRCGGNARKMLDALITIVHYDRM
jgi:hypothetical protein